jgi:alkanesulfonate monooxygenase SsuD/methylene tetrahydromethanopterin reductase-like flavin-dependent oxidoreductase (luciferase family)
VRFLLEHGAAGGGLDEHVGLALAAHAAGLDGVLVHDLVAAAAVSARVDEVLVAAEVELGGRHPVEVAEEAAVVDLIAAGRLVLVARPAPGAEGRFAEDLDVVRHALAPRPFRFEGEALRVPANLPQNVLRPETRVRVTPAPAQVRLEVWGAGAASRPAALERALGHLADPQETLAELAAAWVAADTPAAIGAPRAARVAWSGAVDLVGRLRAGREAFGQDWACVEAPAEAAAEIGSLVRPRVQIERLTPGLEELWDAERPWEA